MANSFRQKKSLNAIAQSAQLQALMMPFGERVLAEAKNDPNKYYVSLLQLHTNVTKPKKSTNVRRVTVVVGARRDARNTGVQVEAKRGTLARALGVL